LIFPVYAAVQNESFIRYSSQFKNCNIKYTANQLKTNFTQLSQSRDKQVWTITGKILIITYS